MMKRILIWLLPAALTVGAAAVGQPLTLREAMNRAREQAREATAADYRAQAGAARLKQAKSYRLPSISLQEVWLRTDSPAEVFALQLQQKRFSFSDFVMSDPNNPDPIENALTRLELTLPIYTGGELSRRIRQAELAAAAAEEDASWAEQGASLAAAEAYILLVQAREQVELLERSLETVQAHVDLAEAYVGQGMLVRSELLRAEVERARIQDLMSEAGGMARVAEANLAFRLATDPATSWELEGLPDPRPLADELEAWLAAAESRDDLEAARRMLEAGQLEARVRRSGLYPKVGAVARLDWNDDRPFGTQGDSSAVMAVASISLFSGGRDRQAAAAAEAEAEAGRQEVEHFAAAVRLQVREAYEKARTARERHHTALAAQEAAREVERITQQRFKQGVAKTLDLLDATTALREAETRELTARAGAHLEALRLAVQAGRSPESVLP